MEEKDMAGVKGGVRDEEDEEEGEEDDDLVLQEAEDSFFNSMDRVPSGVSIHFGAHSSDSSDDDEDHVRFSFASAVGPPSFRRISFSVDEELVDHNNNNGSEVGSGVSGGSENENFDYGIWMAEPISIKERRRILLQGMGLNSSRDMVSSKNGRMPSCRSRAPSTRYSPPSSTDAANAPGGPTPSLPPQPEPEPQPCTITRCRSDSQLWAIGDPAGPILLRSSSAPPSFGGAEGGGRISGERGGNMQSGSGEGDMNHLDDPCKIKNLDTGNEFVVSEYQNDGSECRLNEVQTGIEFTLEEFEKFLGHSPIVKELMRRVGSGDNKKTTDIGNENGSGNVTENDNDTAKTADSRAVISKNVSSKPFGSGGGNGRKKASWLKNIKIVASSVTGLISDKEKDHHHHNSNHASNSSERLKVHQHGKSHKELTGLYMCQEIQAHHGSIWTIKFSTDSRYLASAGEDHVVRVWEVIECDILSSSLRRQDQTQSSPVPPLPNGAASINRSNQPSKKTKKGRTSLAKRRNSLPDYIVMPETVFSLTQKPVCSFEGHLDDVLDLSWSKSQYLLSSSMDKTVRLWDLETKTCLKLFAHNDYVTCIQFNPIDDQYFISGSLDAKVRIWSIPDRRVVDWSDLHEMVTAACYTPDGQGALVGSHKGSCRLYNTSDYKLNQQGQIDIRTKKKKSTAKKVTGFQFAPDNPSEVLVTSADSQIRVFDGKEMVHKFRGFRNTTSQIAASCSLDGKYVVCASEDSHVYIWKRDRACNASGGSKGKGWVTTRSHEHFYCKNVSVAIPWPNGGSNCEPSPSLPTWSRSSPSNLEDAFPSNRSTNSPSPTKNGFLESPSRSGSGVGSSSSLSASASLSSGGGATCSSSSSATSSLSSWRWGGNSNRNGCNLDGANAWGLVVVTAGQGGTIRVYQNFGLPLRLSRQANLF